MAEKLKWGVIGAGGIAKRRTIPEGIIPARNAELTAVMDIDKERASAVAQEFGVKCYFEESALLKDKDVEVVYVATPVCCHAQQVIAAAREGKHILCEKTMALTVKECEEMIATCEKYNVKLSLGYMMRFHSCHREAERLIKEGVLGEITFARAQLSCWYPVIEGAWRQEPKLGGGGALIDMGSHCIDLLEMFLGKVSEVSCFTSNQIHRYPVEDGAVILLRFKNGAQGVVDNFFNIPDGASRNILEIYGTRGSIRTEGTIGQSSSGEISLYFEEEAKDYDAQQERVGGKEKKISPEPVNIYQAEVEAFSKCIQENTSPEISPEEGLWNLKICLAAYQSAKTGQVVKL
jgi:predicted dehydrogenase